MTRLIKIVFITLILLISVEARRSGGSRSSSRSSSYSRSTRSSYGGSYRSGRSNYYYSGTVIIAGPAGTYYTGYGNQCPHGCAVHGRCGTYDECTMTFTDWIWVVLFCLCFCCCGCIGNCGKKENAEVIVEEHVSHHSSHHSFRKSGSSHSSSDKKKENLEPLV